MQGVLGVRGCCVGSYFDDIFQCWVKYLCWDWIMIRIHENLLGFKLGFFEFVGMW
jgi:hypothetical protein